MPELSNAVGHGSSRGAPDAARSLTVLFDSLAHQAQTRLGITGQTVFFLGDGLQRAAVDLAFQAAGPRAWSPASLWQLAQQGIGYSRRIAGTTEARERKLASQELRNKAEVFQLVRDLPRKLNLPPVGSSSSPPLEDMIRRAYDLPPFEALWAVEGLGHYYTDSRCARFGDPQGLFTEARVSVTEESLLMLHAGMGLSFAERLLGSLAPDAPSHRAAQRVVEHYIALCRDNARPGYLGAAIESLGLETRVFYPSLLPVIQRQMVCVYPELAGFFWHGVGRALYFSRRYFLPLLTDPWAGLREEVPEGPARRNAAAGLAWAVTLVNMRQPEILKQVLFQADRSPELRPDFINGVISSLLMRYATTPNDPVLRAFLAHAPADAPFADRWRREIAEPARVALEDYYPVLRRHAALDQDFRDQDLAALVARLESGYPRVEASPGDCCEVQLP